MARYTVTVDSPKSPTEAFSYMADLTNFAEWDPGVIEATQVTGNGPGPDAAFDVEVKAVPKPLTLRYQTTTYEPDTTMVARAESDLLVSLDTITVTPTERGSAVTYDAELTLKGVLAVADPILSLAFKRIGDRAAAGLVDALDGERAPAS